MTVEELFLPNHLLYLKNFLQGFVYEKKIIDLVDGAKIFDGSEVHAQEILVLFVRMLPEACEELYNAYYARESNSAAFRFAVDKFHDGLLYVGAPALRQATNDLFTALKHKEEHAIDTFDYLQGEKAELRDHIFIFTEKNLFDPSTNICAGIRWLFRKRELAKAALKREPTWEESVMSFKGDLSPYAPNSDGMKRFRALYNELRR